VNFSTCAYVQFFNFFLWWSRDHFSAPFRGRLYLPNAWSQTLQTSKRHTFRVSAFHRCHWFGVDYFLLAVRRIVEGYPKTRKYSFWIWLRPRYKISEFFTIAPVLTSTLTFAAESRRSVLSILDRVRYKYYRKKHILADDVFLLHWIWTLSDLFLSCVKCRR